MKAFKKSCKLMGSAFEFCVIDASASKAHRAIEKGIAETERIEQLLSEFINNSITSILNSKAGNQPEPVSEEVFELINRSQQISTITNGFFDISVGPLKKLYQFKRQNFAMPSNDDIRQALKKVGFNHIELNANNNSVYLKKSQMHISFAAIGKGYAADCVKKLWVNDGIEAGYINASGDLSAFGYNETGEPWKVGIANPDTQKDILFYVPLNHVAVATSGDYEQHFMYKGERFSHNINPLTGFPIKGIKSVSVFSPSAELSDALATAVYAMGTEKGIRFIDRLPQTHAIIIDDNNTVFFSKHLNYEAVT